MFCSSHVVPLAFHALPSERWRATAGGAPPAPAPAPAAGAAAIFCGVVLPIRLAVSESSTLVKYDVLAAARGERSARY